MEFIIRHYSDASYRIFDDKNRMKYLTERVSDWACSIKIVTKAGECVAVIKDKVFKFMPKYRLFNNGNFIGEVARRYTFIPKFRVKGLEWSVVGDKERREFKIYNSEKDVGAELKKKLFKMTDTYYLNITDEECAFNYILVALSVLEEKHNKNYKDPF